MADHILPGALPGLLRRGSPVRDLVPHPIDGDLPGVVCGIYGPDAMTCWPLPPSGDQTGTAPFSEFMGLAGLTLDLSDPTGRFHAALWLAAGERCPTCHHTEGLPTIDVNCCNGTGYTRAPHRLFWALDNAIGGDIQDYPGLPAADLSAALLWWSAMSVAAGGLPIAGVLGVWRSGERCLLAGVSARTHVVYGAALGHPWWTSADGASGHVGGAEGQSCADRAALLARFALLDLIEGATVLRLPELPGESR